MTRDENRVDGTQALRARHPWRSRLQTRLVSYFLLLSGLLVTLAAMLVFFGVRETLQGEKYRDLLLAAALQKEHLYQWLDTSREDVELLVSSPEISDPARRLLDSPGEAERTAAYAELRAAISRIRRVKPALREIVLLDVDGGEVLLSSSSEHEGEFRSHDHFFLEGLKGLYVQGVYPSSMTLRPTVTISAPLVGANDETLGVLAAHLDLELLDELIGRLTEVGLGGESYLVDKFGGLVSARRLGYAEGRLGLGTDGVQQALAGRDGAARYESYDGEVVIGSYGWIEELEVALLVEVPAREALAPARAVAVRVLLLSAFLVLALSLGTYLLARRIARPVRRITAAALRVGEGDLQTAIPVPTEDEIGTLAATFNGMTARLRDLYRKLESEIAERRLAQEERERFVTELEARNAELERFTYTVSHDLKSPLVTIAGFLSVVRRDVESGTTDRLDHHFARIEDAVGKMKQSLDELLELSRVGRVVNPPEPCDLSELCHEALEMVGGEVRLRGVEVTIQPDMPVVLADRTRLREVFLNLLSNAVKFLGEQPRPAIQIGGRAGEEIVCWVRDNGIGVPSDYHDKIFGLFERLHTDTEGSGIGLALVRRIIEVHGGRVWVESDASKAGSTFWFALPAACAPAPRRERELAAGGEA